MSKFVLVEFEDDESADKFIEKTQNHSSQSAMYRLAGVYQRPNAWCGCPFQVQGVLRPVSRGKKFGWWVCGWCKKPRPGTQQLANLLRDKTPINERKFEYIGAALWVYESPNPRRVL